MLVAINGGKFFIYDMCPHDQKVTYQALGWKRFDLFAEVTCVRPVDHVLYEIRNLLYHNNTRNVEPVYVAIYLYFAITALLGHNRLLKLCSR